MTVKNKVIVVTGGAGSFGKEIIKTLQHENSKVISIDLNENEDSISYTADLTNENEVVCVVNKIIEKFQTIDVLINNAGMIYNEPILNLFNEDKMRHSLESFKKCKFKSCFRI